MNAIRWLTQQHREIEKWFEQLEQYTEKGRERQASDTADYGWEAGAEPAPPDVRWQVRGTDSGEEIREYPGGAGVETWQPEDEILRREESHAQGAIPPESEHLRRATPPRSEADGRSGDSIPGEEFRDFAGRHPDGKTHVGMDDERVMAQMFTPDTGRPRPGSTIGQGRENLAGSMEQLDNPVMASTTGGRVGLRHSLTGGTPSHIAGAGNGDSKSKPHESRHPGTEEASGVGQHATHDLPAGGAPTYGTGSPASVPEGLHERGASIRNVDLAVMRGAAGTSDAPQAHAEPQVQGGRRTAGGGGQMGGGSAAENVGVGPTPAQKHQVQERPQTAAAAPVPGEDAAGRSVRTGRDREHKRALFNRLADNIAAHGVIEEQLLYPNALETPASVETAQAHRVHHEIVALLEHLRHLDVDTPEFRKGMTELRSLVQSHVEEEEREIFPVLLQALGTPRLEELGMLMYERYRAIVGLERRFSVAGIEGVEGLQAPLVEPGHVAETVGPEIEETDRRLHLSERGGQALEPR